ncbi:4-alpha-glucanotransferase [Terracidiphilus sp.]|jgi:4-alpha-glucanotransferase|uniref:4-alpha-glucanotransferase n=1 Tax=Terracidiphilus sp. TaxID=1964191 RepID=UPI003C209005
MDFARSSGVLLHVASLPSRGPIGDLGPAAYEFVEFLAAAKQHVWQVLPLCPTGYGNSPYAGTSAFAGNPNLISLELLADWEWIARERVAKASGGALVDYGAVENEKLPLLREAARNFLDRGPSDPKLAEQWQAFAAFCAAEAHWLNDFAMYAVLRDMHGTGAWTHWPESVRRRETEALKALVAGHGRELAVEQALQFAFSLQWNQLRNAAARSAIRVLGDIAIFVSMDSADVWTHPGIFELDEELRPVHVAGVPPDYFSATGQRWGNPLYRWDVLAELGYSWWVDRVRRSCQLYDIVRLDHFRGFEGYWSIPASEETAVHGEWVKGPGMALFSALEAALGPLPLVAEDLGLITPAVDALRLEAGMPGMKVMQFGFGGKGAHPHLPHRYTRGTVAYTGTHDNDTTQGWWNRAKEQERAAVEAYVGPVADRPVWPLIRAIEVSVAEIAIAPAQDLLELGDEARMNTPAVAGGNWGWRAAQGAWTAEIAERLAALAEVTDRQNDPLAKGDAAQAE